MKLAQKLSTNYKPYCMILLTVFAVLLVLTRFYNLETTARFTRDESSDLARMHEYFDTKKITLVGPISSEGDKVFSSLTYYLIMPFAAATDFLPVGPVYGTAFWGVITGVFLLLVTHKVNPKMLYPAAALILVWYPLVEMSRWAWNPHFVVLWFALGMSAYFYRDKLKGTGLFLTALFLGLTFHHHYVSFLAVTPFIVLLAYDEIKTKNFKQIIALLAGYSIAFLPFIVFDLRHPPGLFFGQYLLGGNTPHIESSLDASTIFSHLSRNYRAFLSTISQQAFFQVILGLLIPVLTAMEIKQKLIKNLYWVTPLVALLISGVVLDDMQSRYIYTALGFFFIWVLLPRKATFNRTLSHSILYTLIISSMLTIWPQLTIPKKQPDMYSFTQAAQYIEHTIKTKQLNNANVAALASRDPAPLAETYRDVIRMNGAGVRAPSEYDVSEHLFVASTANEQTLRQDESYAMQVFKDTNLLEVYQVPNSEWKVYWFSYANTN